METTYRYLAMLLVAAFLLGSCSAGNIATDLHTRPIRIVATVGMIADVAREIGGERVEVIGLMGPGVDPHLYKPSAGDVRKLEQADVILYGGLSLEGRMVDVFATLGQNGKHTFAVTDDIDRALLRKPAEFEGKYDPHVWFDVLLWQQVARTISARLAEIDPQSHELYERNTAAYTARLTELHQYVQQQIATIPENQRVLVTAHDAFGYFGQQYGVEVRGLQGTSTATEAGAADVQNLAAFLCERSIPAIFVESSVPPATVNAVKEAALARGCSVAIGGQLFSDALGTAGTPEGTYIGMVRHNVDTIVAALRGEAG